jgi:ring-1,2-phenylacetyl-CoA epoxidase subunit PaaC
MADANSPDGDSSVPDIDLDAVETLSARERTAVETQLRRLADDELVVAERYTYWQVRAPTLESDIALANIAQDELGHARLWYDLLSRFGHDETDLIWERDPAEFQHSTLGELPFEEGDWADAVVRSYLYDVAEDIRVHALAESSVPAIRDRVEKLLGEEEYHLDHADSWLERLAADADGRANLQEALDRLYPHALTLFAPAGDIENDIEMLGIRTATLSEMREEWLTRVGGTLEGLGLTVPDARMADPVGRDGAHTDHWAALHDEMTETYDHLERDSATTIMS